MKRKIVDRVIILLTALFIMNYLFLSPVLAGVTVDGIWGNNVRSYINSNSNLPTNISDPRIAAINIINIVLGCLGIIFLIIILYGGFKWMMSGGNEDSISSARKIIVAGIIGLAIILAAYAIANFVINSLLYATTGDVFN